VRIGTAHRDYWSSQLRPEGWLLIEWPSAETEPTIHSADRHQAFRLGSFGEASLDHKLKQELGMGHYDGRWRGFHNYATLCIVGLRVPGRRMEPFFLLRSWRPLGLTQPRLTSDANCLMFGVTDAGGAATVGEMLHTAQAIWRAQNRNEAVAAFRQFRAQARWQCKYVVQFCDLFGAISSLSGLHDDTVS
jgi:hypothetical protein